LQEGIKVVASVNVQYIAELREQVEAITGKYHTQTVPVCFIKSADEIEIVDTPPEEPIAHLSREQVDVAQRQQRLSKLRELALVLTADVVDRQLVDYLRQHGLRQQFGAHERLLVCITPRSNIQEMIGTARIIAERFHAELIVAYVAQPQISAAGQSALDERLASPAPPALVSRFWRGRIWWKHCFPSPKLRVSRRSSSGIASAPESRPKYLEAQSIC